MYQFTHKNRRTRATQGTRNSANANFDKTVISFVIAFCIVGAAMSVAGASETFVLIGSSAAGFLASIMSHLTRWLFE